MDEMFGVATANIDADVRTGGAVVALSRQMVNGPQMRRLIGRSVALIGAAIGSHRVVAGSPLGKALDRNLGAAIGLVLGAIADFAFNMEYVRRITDQRWSYCSRHGQQRVFFPFLGVCPACIISANRPQEAALGITGRESMDERESKARYFGNKVESHHVGRIGERVVVYILDLLSKSKFPDAKTLLVHDDQHDVDAAILFDGKGVLTQIKASPLVLLPVVSDLAHPLVAGHNPDTGLPEPRRDHTFTDFPTAENELALFFSLDGTSLPLGRRAGQDWPYRPFLDTLDEEAVLRIVNNWIEIYDAFAIPKRVRTGGDVQKAFLTAGWGAPIDDNKTKAGLARSDNMMKGTYASLKYGAYYVQECEKKSLRTALVANIDPAHQYADYLEKLHDIRWGHNADFRSAGEIDGAEALLIDASKLTFLFDSVFTFNRQIMNDPALAALWNLQEFGAKLSAGTLTAFLSHWEEVPQ